MNRKIYNRLPVVASLLILLQDHGFSLIEVSDGEAVVKLEGTPRQRRQLAKSTICFLGEAEILVRKNDKDEWLYIDTNATPEQSVLDSSKSDEINDIISDFKTKWKS